MRMSMYSVGMCGFMLLAVAPVQGGMILVDSRSDLDANAIVDWSGLTSPLTQPQTLYATDGNRITVTWDAGPFVQAFASELHGLPSLVVSGSLPLHFAWSGGITLTFETPVSKVGADFYARVLSSAPGNAIVFLNINSLPSLFVAASPTTTRNFEFDGFIGLKSDAEDIKTVRFSAGAAGFVDGRGFGVAASGSVGMNLNTLDTGSLNDSEVPEPGTCALFSMGAISIVMGRGWRRRRFATG